ncbi:RES family NAD+ phosphorylase [Streptomyces scabiei]|uniref:RES family NAD+ phosphorylase n=1 Tax=Streptomyces scabiei TaxID=1930 RepID=UPI0038F80B33
MVAVTEELPTPKRKYFTTPLQTSDVEILEARSIVGRIYRRGGDHPTTWDKFRNYGAIPGTGRFDHHPLPAHRDHNRHAVLYGSLDDRECSILTTCLLECFPEWVNRSMGQPHFVIFQLTRPVYLLNLRSRWLKRCGGNGAIFDGDHVMSERWSREIYLHYRNRNGRLIDSSGVEQNITLDGLYYRSSSEVPGATCIALYETAKSAIPTNPLTDIPLSDSSLDNTLDSVCPPVGLKVAPLALKRSGPRSVRPPLPTR